MMALFEGKSRRVLIIDHGDSQMALAAETREFFQANLPSFALDKFALVGLTNLTRIVARIVTTVSGQSDKTGFFKTDAEALAWINRPG